MRRDIVAVIPAFNCAGTVGQVVEGCRSFLATVVVVDDGSSDGTVAEAVARGARVEVLGANRGKGCALRYGIDVALDYRPAAVVMLDADGQHDPGDLPSLAAAWDQGRGELVIGSRMAEYEAIPRSRYWTNYIGSRILSWMTGFDLKDSQSGFRLLAAGLLARLELTAEGFAIESEMLLKAARLGARVVHVPVRTIYNGAPSHFRPVLDTVRICRDSIYYKVFDEA